MCVYATGNIYISVSTVSSVNIKEENALKYEKTNDCILLKAIDGISVECWTEHKIHIARGMWAINKRNTQRKWKSILDIEMNLITIFVFLFFWFYSLSSYQNLFYVLILNTVFMELLLLFVFGFLV